MDCRLTPVLVVAVVVAQVLDVVTWMAMPRAAEVNPLAQGLHSSSAWLLKTALVGLVFVLDEVVRIAPPPKYPVIAVVGRQLAELVVVLAIGVAAAGPALRRGLGRALARDRSSACRRRALRRGAARRLVPVLQAASAGERLDRPQPVRVRPPGAAVDRAVSGRRAPVSADRPAGDGPMTDDDLRPYSIDEVADLIGRSVSTVRRRIASGFLRTVPGDPGLVTRRSVERWLSGDYDAADASTDGTGDDRPVDADADRPEALADRRDDAGRQAGLAGRALAAGGGAHPAPAGGRSRARPRPVAPDGRGLPPFVDRRACARRVTSGSGRGRSSTTRDRREPPHPGARRPTASRR
jgi:hypothetical protein